VWVAVEANVNVDVGVCCRYTPKFIAAVGAPIVVMAAFVALLSVFQFVVG